MNYRTGKILLITSLLLLPAAWSPAWGEEPAFLYTHIHREGSSVTREESQVEEKTSSKTTTHSDVSVNLPSAPAACVRCFARKTPGAYSRHCEAPRSGNEAIQAAVSDCRGAFSGLLRR